jgi:hypothetical protein
MGIAAKELAMAIISSGIVVTVPNSLGLSDTQISTLQSAFAAELVQVLGSTQTQAAEGPSIEAKPQISRPVPIGVVVQTQ